MRTPPVLILTRVRDEAGPWADALAAAGIGVDLLPLIEIVPVPDAAPLEHARQAALQCDALMFVSASAARHFFAGQEALSQRLTARLWATGPGTRRALIQCGCHPDHIDAPADDAAQFDSEALWETVALQARPGARVLIVRGADASGQVAGRDWLARQLEAAGAQVDEVATYLRRAPAFDAATRARMQAAAGDGSVWWFSSSEAVLHLQHALPAQDWSAARAVATHPRIAHAARQAGFGRVVEARAQVEDIIASIESFA